jgi:type II secretory pathway component PulC
MMATDVNVIWRKGDAELPQKAKLIVDEAKNELLLKTLQLPDEMVDAIRYNSQKNAQSISEYVSDLLLKQLKTA